MKIKSLDFKSEELANGLKDIKMDKLGQIVLLTGPNGGGKTRLLSTIERTLKDYPSDQDKSRLYEEQSLLGGTEYNLEEKRIHKNHNAISIDELKKLKSKIRSRIIDLDNKLSKNKQITLDNTSENPVVVYFTPTENKLIDPLSMTEGAQKKESDTLKDDLKNSKWEIAAPALLQQCTKKMAAGKLKNHNSTHQSQRDFDEFNKLLTDLLGEEIVFNDDLNASLFGFPIGEAQLSPGQSILLQLAAVIFAQGGKLDNLILIMDEPEIHLHPAAAIKVISLIREKVPNGQIWISTHSLTILSAFYDENIWYMDKGEISWVGRKIETVLDGLIGEDNNDKLRSFIDLPFEFAIKHFAVECLQMPGSVMTQSTDPQTQQIVSEIQDIIPKNNNVKILDYGAGKGRIISGLKETTPDLKEKIDYVAFDSYPDDEKICRENISSAYDSSDSRYYNDITTLKMQYGEKAFDIVVCCNVFHEISPLKWKKTIDCIHSLLKPQGYLFLLEDNLMPHGERAHEFGFIALDKEAIDWLFQAESTLEKIKHASANNRLHASLIPCCILCNITHESQKKAIKSLQKQAKKKVQEIPLQSQTNTYKSGLEYAFWSQQYINITLAIEKMYSKKYKKTSI